VPFLPSLLHEAEIGCDVHFDRPGVALLIQFKLGQELKQFRRKKPSITTPDLDRPFWRFEVDTAEEDGQYDLLLKAESAGAEVYYVAPRFTDWDRYAAAFQSAEVLDHSLMMRPSNIDGKLRAQGEPDGPHKVVYDTRRVYVFSAPIQVGESRKEDVSRSIKEVVKEREEPMGSALKRILNSFSERREIRLASDAEPATAYSSLAAASSPREIGRSFQEMKRERTERLQALGSRSRTEEDAIFASVGIETWASGSQLVAVTLM
jgi:hypothetical protein